MKNDQWNLVAISYINNSFTVYFIFILGYAGVYKYKQILLFVKSAYNYWSQASNRWIVEWSYLTG